MMKSIGMIVAVEMDSVLSRYGASGVREDRGGFAVYHYQMEGFTLHVVNSGVGELAAAAATELLIDAYGVELVVNFGVVGGLTEEMALARTCVVEKIVHYDFDLSGIDPVEPGRYPGYEEIYIPTTRSLLERAAEIVPGLRRVICASADKFIGEPGAKAALHEKYGADICEMEAAGVVLTCNRCGIPCLVMKTVSDGIDGGAEEFYAEVRRSSELCLEITEKIIKEL